MTLIDQCFWTYPVEAPIPPGQPLTFQVIVPPLSATLPTGSIVTWSLSLLDANGNVPAGGDVPLQPGKDYQILAGDMHAPMLSVVFAPDLAPIKRWVSVAPTLKLFYLDGLTSLPDDDTHAFAPVKYQLDVFDPAVHGTAVAAMLAKSIRLVAKKLIIEPGDPAQVAVAPESMMSVPQLVTSVLDEAPSVEIRGAIPLKSLVEAIIGPLTGALGHVLPGSKASLEEIGGDVQRLLGEPLSIPIALDVLGKRISKTLVPVGTPEVPFFTATPGPEQANALEGMVPIGKWQERFVVTVKDEWIVERLDRGTWEADKSDLSPGLDFLKTFLIRPDVVPLSTRAVSPTPARVTVTLEARLETLATTVVLDPPLQLELLLLPLPLPRVAALFRHAFDNPDKLTTQSALVAVDAATSAVVPTLDDCLRLLTRLTTALNNVVAVANALNADWEELLGVATAASVMADELGRIRPGRIMFAPQWRGRRMPTTMPLDGKPSAIIYVGARGLTRLELYTSQQRIVTMVRPGSESLYSILPNLNVDFSETVQIPPGSADSLDEEGNYHDGNYHNELDEFRFVAECPATTHLGGTDLAESLPMLRDFRDRDLVRTAVGRRVVDLVEDHAAELTQLLAEHSELSAGSLDLARRLAPIIETRHERSAPKLRSDLLEAIDASLELISYRASVSLQDAISTSRKDLRRFAGRTLLEGLGPAARTPRRQPVSQSQSRRGAQRKPR